MPTHFKGSPRQLRALDAYIKLRRANESLNRELNRGIEQSGLTESQFGVLEALLHLGDLPQTVLADKILRTSANVTLVVSNLERRRLVRRRRDPSDRRLVLVRLTASGRSLIRRVFPSHVERIVTLLDALSAKEQEQLGRLCKKLGLSVAERF